MLTKVELVGQISKLHERDAREHPKATRATDIPVSYDAITAEWLTAILCGGIETAQVTEFSFSAEDNGSTNRRRIFLSYNAVGTAADLPRSVFSKASNSLPSRLNMGLCGAAHGEKMFYTKIRSLLDLEAPLALHCNYDPQSFASIVVLKDMADTVVFPDQKVVMDWDRASRMVSVLAKLHATMSEHQQLESFDIPTFPQFWDRICTYVDMEESAKTGFLAAESVVPPRLFKRFSEFWPATMRSVAAHDRLPRTLVHNDVHLRNWYLRPPSGMGLMDWQCICVGNWSRDYAYAMTVALEIEDRRRWEKELLRIYISGVAEHGGPRIAFNEAWDLYRTQIPSALAFWTNTLRPSSVQPKDMQPQDTALAFIKRMSHAMDDLDVLDVATAK